MNYKGYEVTSTDWQIGDAGASRFLIFEVTQDTEQTKFVFNHNFSDYTAQENGLQQVSVEQLRSDAAEMVKEGIREGQVFREHVYFFEKFPERYVRSDIPDWYTTLQ